MWFRKGLALLELEGLSKPEGLGPGERLSVTEEALRVAKRVPLKAVIFVSFEGTPGGAVQRGGLGTQNAGGGGR